MTHSLFRMSKKKKNNRKFDVNDENEMMAVWNAGHRVASFNFFFFSVFVFVFALRCNAKRIQPSETGKKKFPVTDGHSQKNKIFQKNPESNEGKRKKKRKFIGRTKKCGDNTADGILIMRVEQQQQPQRSTKHTHTHQNTSKFIV